MESQTFILACISRSRRRTPRLFELKPFDVVVQQDLLEVPIRHVDGWVSPPEGPGLGIAVRESVVRQYRVGP